MEMQNGEKVDLEARGINTDTSKAQVVTKDEVVDPIDTDLHTDLFNKEKRKELINDLKQLGEFPSQMLEAYEELAKVFSKENIPVLFINSREEGEPASSPVSSDILSYDGDDKILYGLRNGESVYGKDISQTINKIEEIYNGIKGVSKNAKTVNIFLLKEDKGMGWVPDYGDRSYETYQNKVKSGKITVPSNVKIIVLDPVVPNTIMPADYGTKNHAPAIDYGNKMFDQVWDKYKKNTKIKGAALKIKLMILFFIILYVLVFTYIIAFYNDVSDIKNNSLGFTIILLSEIILFLLGVISSLISCIINTKNMIFGYVITIIFGLGIMLYTDINYPILKLIILTLPILILIIYLRKK